MRIVQNNHIGGQHTPASQYIVPRSFTRENGRSLYQVSSCSHYRGRLRRLTHAKCLWPAIPPTWHAIERQRRRRGTGFIEAVDDGHSYCRNTVRLDVSLGTAKQRKKPGEDGDAGSVRRLGRCSRQWQPDSHIGLLFGATSLTLPP